MAQRGARTLAATLHERASRSGTQLAFRFLRADTTAETVTFAELHASSLRTAAGLRSAGARPGDRVLISVPPGLGYVAAFYGCLYAGCVAVPAYPPRGSRHDQRLSAVAADAAPVLALGASGTAERAARSGVPALRWLTIDELSDTDPLDEPVAGADLAFLQYTSGSTGTPKGVMVTNDAVLANLGSISANFALTGDDRAVSWLPPYHDMGLVGGILTPVYAGIECTLLTPTAFAQDPGGWLAAISRYGATVSGGPDFAYRLCVQRIRPQDSDEWDLSRWRLAFCGAEPVRAATLRDFGDRFAGNGFRDEAWHPCYGLAEATLIVSGADRDKPPHTLERADGPSLISSGHPLCEVRIADPATGDQRPPGEPGEIWVRGPSVARGYWNRPDETAATFTGWLRTGDIGFLLDGELFVAGRVKELIIVRGRNLYPADLEEHVVTAHPLLAGQAAAFSVDSGDGEELGIAVEVDRHTDPRLLGEALTCARRAVVEAAGVDPALLVAVRRGALPRTSSGKVQRGLASRMILAGEIAPLDTAVGAASRGPGHDAATLITALLGGDIPADVPLTQLGVDSLRATELAAAAARAGIALDVGDLLRGATLSELLATSAPVPHTVEVDLQRAFWLHELIHPGSPAYTMAAAVRLAADTDPQRLDEALRALLSAYPVLRSRFGGTGSVVHDPVPPRVLRVADEVGPGDVDARLTELCRPAAQLAVGDLVRATWLPVTGQEPILLLTAHHAVADAHTLGLLCAQLGAVYAGTASVEPQRPPTVQVPARPGDRAWWQGQLAAIESRADFPADRVAAADSGRGAVVRRSVRTDITTLAESCGATWFATVLAAAAIWTARHTGDPHPVIGVPVTARDADTADTVGCLVRMVPVRVWLPAGASAREAVTATRDALAAAIAHASLPLDALVTLSGTRRALFDVVVADDTTPFTPGGHLITSAVEVDRGAAAFPLAMLWQGDRLTLEYATDRFAPATAQRLADRFETLLTAMAANPATPWTALPLGDQAPVAAMAPAPAQTRLLHELVLAVADRAPHAPAIEDGQHRWTYAELRDRALAVTADLRRRGIGPGDRVGLLLPRSADLIAAMLGVLAAGAAYVPLDPAYPAERNQAILADAAVAAVLADLPSTSDEPSVPVVTGADDEAAYLCYTSGSTGAPKGVVIEHRNVVASTAARLAFYPEPVRRFLLLSSAAFDSSVAGIYWTLASGGTLILAPPRTESDPVACWRLLAQTQATHTLMLPSLWSAALEAGTALTSLASLSVVVVAGEECPPTLAARHATALPTCALVNEYGPTEASVWATAHQVTVADDVTVPIGRPVPGMACHVLDPWGNDLPVGVPGELHLGGAQIARGYHQRPDETRSRFLDDPSRGRLYRTGDRVSQRDDGTLLFHGRLDDQVKVRGHRVEPAEIETVLAAHPGVAHCAVTARTGNGQTRLVAYVVPRAHDVGTPAGYRDWLAERLPAAYLPHLVHLLADLPRTPNGKVDRRALPDPRSETSGAGRAPSGPWEEQVAQGFANVLGCARIGAADDFFDLGGHSLAAAQLAARLTAVTGRAVAVADILAAPTVAGLAERLATRDDGDRGAAPIARQPRRAAS